MPSGNNRVCVIGSSGSVHSQTLATMQVLSLLEAFLLATSKPKYHENAFQLDS